MESQPQHLSTYLVSDMCQYLKLYPAITEFHFRIRPTITYLKIQKIQFILQITQLKRIFLSKLNLGILEKIRL